MEVVRARRQRADKGFALALGPVGGQQRVVGVVAQLEGDLVAHLAELRPQPRHLAQRQLVEHVRSRRRQLARRLVLHLQRERAQVDRVDDVRLEVGLERAERARRDEVACAVADLVALHRDRVGARIGGVPAPAGRGDQVGDVAAVDTGRLCHLAEAAGSGDGNAAVQ